MRRLLSKTGWLFEPERARAPTSGVFSIAVGCLIVVLGLSNDLLQNTVRQGLMFAALGLTFIGQGIAETLPTHWRKIAFWLRAASMLLALAAIVIALTVIHNNTMRIILASLTVLVLGTIVCLRYFDYRRKYRRP
jgi:hypothetical protein